MAQNDLTITEPVTLAPRRCFECGRWWAYERFAIDTPHCPVCAERANVEQRKAISELQRTIAGLRGALTKAQKWGR